MRHGKGSFQEYRFKTQGENFSQFKGADYARGRSFVIAAADAGVLKKMHCRIDTNPGFSKADSVIVTRPSGHPELWVDPHFAGHRDAQFAFFDAIGIYLPTHEFKLHDSDHAYPKSAAGPEVGLVKMNLIERAGNRSFGAGWEKRFTHRTLDDYGTCYGNLFDLYKAIGGSIPDPKDPVTSLRAIAEELVTSGLAPRSEYRNLLLAGEDTMAYKQAQDENYAVNTGQVDLSPGSPLVPE
jgi:hypothetical protein